ncbi:MAG: MOP flippase family protein [Chloroflexi bacterium]|nr:MOP flippase family protein [Chloroflexota bacterium]
MSPNNSLLTGDSSLRQQAVRGIGWTAVAQFGRQLIQFIILALLGRLLSTEEFGLLGMTAVFVGFANLFGEMGFTAALIQRQELTPRHLSSVFWLNLAGGVIMALLMAFGAPLISQLYQEPRLTPITLLIAVTFPINALGLVHRAILTRQMRFRALGLSELLAVLASGLLALGLALNQFGVWSLVWQALALAIFTTLFLWGMTRWWPTGGFSRSAIRELWGYSSNLLGYQAFNYWARNGDNFLIGRFLGADALGLYTRAYTTMLLPVNQVVGILGRVLFPTLAKVQDDHQRVKRIYLQTLAAIALISFPMMLGLIIIANNFVLVVFGPQWLPMVRTLQILSLVGLLQSVGSTVGWLYQAQGRTDWMFKWGIAAGTLSLISFVVGTYLGSIETVALCYAILALPLSYWGFAIPGRLIQLSMTEVLLALAPIFGLSCVMAGITAVTTYFLPPTWPAWFQLAVQTAVGGTTYLGLILLLKPAAYRHLCHVILRQRRENSQS